MKRTVLRCRHYFHHTFRASSPAFVRSPLTVFQQRCGVSRVGMELAIRRLEVRGPYCKRNEQCLWSEKARPCTLSPEGKKFGTCIHVLQHRTCAEGKEGPSRCTSMVSCFHDTVRGFTQKSHTVLERRILPPRHTYEALAECNRRSVRITVDEVGIRRLEISFHPLSNTGYYQMTRTKR